MKMFGVVSGNLMLVLVRNNPTLSSNIALEYLDSRLPAGFLQCAVESGQRRPMPDRDIQIGGGVRRKTIFPRDRKNIAHTFCDRLRIYDNRQSVQQLDKAPNLGWFDPFAPLGRQHRIRDFNRPQRWNQDRVSFECDEYPVCVLACLIRKAPSERHGRIDNNPGQNRRPSSTI